MVKAARLRPEDHINSESVLCCEEAIFESLPLDLLLDQLLEALFVIHWDFYNLHFNEQQWWWCCGRRYHWNPLTTDSPCSDKSSKAKSLNLKQGMQNSLLGGIFLRKCKFAKSLLVQAIGGQGWIEIQNWILSIVLDTEKSSATHLSENPQVRLDTREIPTGDTERHTDNCDTTSDTNRPTQSNNAVFTSQRHNNSAPSLSRTMTSFQVKDKIDHNKFHNCGSSNTYVYTTHCRIEIQRREQTSFYGYFKQYQVHHIWGLSKRKEPPGLVYFYPRWAFFSFSILRL